MPIVRGWQIFHEANLTGSGLARRPRYVMSHETGKIEILAVDEGHIYLRYHRAKDEADRGRFMIYKRNDEAVLDGRPRAGGRRRRRDSRRRRRSAYADEPGLSGLARSI